MYIDNRTLEKILLTNKSNELVYIFIKFLWHTGARLVEALDTVPINISSSSNCININNKRKRTRKEEYYRKIDVPEELIEELTKFINSNHIKDDERIFKFTSKTAINYVREACIAAGVQGKVTPKIFRNSFTQNQIVMGTDDFNLSYLLGNSDINKTRSYRKQISSQNIA